MGTVAVGSYKDVRGVILENDALRVVVLPDWGSKIASIRYKPLDSELLWQNPAQAFRKSDYADDYEMGDTSAFDEMFPTISRCFYERFPWAGTEVPDHGEVWSIPWDCSLLLNGVHLDPIPLDRIQPDYRQEGGSVRLSVQGVQFPYLLEKRISLEESRLRIDYSAQNLSGFEFDFIWAAHPLFNTSKGMELVVPPGMRKIVNAVSGARLGGYGAMYDFPNARIDDGSSFNLGEVPERNSYGYQKYWFLGKVTEGWCMLHDRSRSLTIGMAYPREKVPYLGVWLNEGAWEGQYNIAPEPATGAMDRIDFARMWGMNSVLEGRETFRWHLIISVMTGKKPSGVNENGEFAAP